MEVVDVAGAIAVLTSGALAAPENWPDAGRRRLHCGSSGNLLAGWLNTDIARLRDPTGRSTDGAALYRVGDALYFEHDATTPFPLPDGFFDAVFSEHFIEHIPFSAAPGWAREMHRMLTPGGVLRVSTPSLAKYVDGYLDPRQDFFRRHAATIRPIVADLHERRAWMVNQIFYAWGHRYIYDFEELAWLLRGAGFAPNRITECHFRQGTRPDVSQLDLEHRADESIWVEAVK